EAGSGERGADRARVNYEVAGVRAGVDARHDEIGWFAEAAERRREHRGRGRRVERVHGDAGNVGPVDARDLGGFGREELADGGAGAAAIVDRRYDNDVVAVACECTCQRLDPRRVHTVVVGDEDPHAFTLVAAATSSGGWRDVVTGGDLGVVGLE